MTKKRLQKSTQGKTSKDKQKCTSQYIGVYAKKESYHCIIRYNNKTISRKCESEILAAEMFDKCSLYIYGSDARINFDDKREQYLLEDLKIIFDHFLKREILSNSSLFRYITVDKKTQKWGVNYKVLGLSLKDLKGHKYDSKEEAAKMVDYINIYFNLKKPLNFPIADYNLEDIRLVIDEFIKNKKMSKYRGVAFDKTKNKWMCYYNRKTIGSRPNEEDAYKLLIEYKNNLNIQ